MTLLDLSQQSFAMDQLRVLLLHIRNINTNKQQYKGHTPRMKDVGIALQTRQFDLYIHILKGSGFLD